MAHLLLSRLPLHLALGQMYAAFFIMIFRIFIRYLFSTTFSIILLVSLEAAADACFVLTGKLKLSFFNTFVNVCLVAVSSIICTLS